MNSKGITLKSFIWQSRLIGIVPEHCFNITLADFEQIINNDIKQLEADWLSDTNFCVIPLKAYPKKEKPQSFTVKSLLSAFIFF